MSPADFADQGANTVATAATKQFLFVDMVHLANKR
jgi:hypothetical protein